MSDRPRGPRSRRAVLVALGVVIALIALGATAFVVASVASSSPRDGAAIARDQVDNRARAIAEDLGYWYGPIDAESLAARYLTSPDGFTVRPFAWSGSTDDPAGADVDVLIRVSVSASPPSGVFQPSVSAGTAEKCFRFHVRDTQDVSYRSIDCPASGVLATPTPIPEPALSDDAEARLADALASAEPATLDAAVRAAFPESDVTVDVTVTPAGDLVAAVGVAPARDCIVMVRGDDGSVERISFDPVQLEPGEQGCSVTLYTAPAS